jgi:hypothetical protein
VYQSRLRRMVKLFRFCGLAGEVPFSSGLPGVHCGAHLVL